MHTLLLTVTNHFENLMILYRLTKRDIKKLQAEYISHHLTNIKTYDERHLMI